MSDLVIFRLMNGDEVIAKATENELMVDLEDPIQIFMVPDGSGRVKMAMAPYMPYLLSHSVIKTSICVYGVPADEMANQYREITGGIVVPSKQIITG